MQNLHWVKSIDNKWLNFSQLDLTHIHAVGVYIIWHGGENPQIVRVGQGNIAAKLTGHRMNHQIMRFGMRGPLMVTWAEIAEPARRDGIEAYLIQQFTPIIRDRAPEAVPIAASSPFAS